jgi:hypothetical protein
MCHIVTSDKSNLQCTVSNEVYNGFVRVYSFHHPPNKPVTHSMFVSKSLLVLAIVALLLVAASFAQEQAVYEKDSQGITKIIDDNSPEIKTATYTQNDAHVHNPTAVKINNLLTNLVDKLHANHEQHKETVKTTKAAFDAAIAAEEAARIKKEKAQEKVNLLKAQLAAAEKELAEAIAAWERAVAALEEARRVLDKAIIEHNNFVKNMVAEKTLVNKINDMMQDLISVRETNTDNIELTGTKV